MEITQKEDVTAYAYADDIVIGSKSLKETSEYNRRSGKMVHPT